MHKFTPFTYKQNPSTILLFSKSVYLPAILGTVLRPGCCVPEWDEIHKLETDWQGGNFANIQKYKMTSVTSSKYP